MVDQRALKILLNTYWSPAGWTRDPMSRLSPEDFTYAKSKGVMFDASKLDHVQWLAKLITAVQQLDRRAVADAFLASLSSRRVEWRSALGSYAVFQHIKAHPPESNGKTCTSCGFDLDGDEEDLNVLNFERHKWGGVRHSQITYAAMDLDLFLQDSISKPRAEDKVIFRNIISALTATSPRVTSAAAQALFSGVVKSNKGERDMIVAILGFCGILGTAAHPGYSNEFVVPKQRKLPDRHFVDMPYPACWWRREDGMNDARLHDYFGHVL